MKHENIVRIYHKDTDCYGVVWHGAYIKWFEIGRVELSKMAGIDFEKIDEMGILLPVVELNCRYKSPAKLFDEINITTEISKLKQTSIAFSHTITNAKTGKLILNASSTIVTTDRNAKLFKKIPDYLYSKYEAVINNLSI